MLALSKDSRSVWRGLISCLALCAALMLLAGCGNLRYQPKLDEPYDASPNFEYAARTILPEAVPVGYLNQEGLSVGELIDGELTDEFPVEVTEELILRGQERYEIFCTPCHGYAGYGDGVLAEEGIRPASFHDEEIRAKPVGHYVQVIAEGQGIMYNYAARVPPEDRWAVAAYIRTLQLSQEVNIDELPAEAQEDVNSLQ
jgi:mono/diheme cytochrome c family protein